MKKILFLSILSACFSASFGQAPTYDYNFDNTPLVFCNDNQTYPCSNFFTNLPNNGGGYLLTGESQTWVGNTARNLFSVVTDNQLINSSGSLFQMRAGATNDKANRFSIDEFGKVSNQIDFSSSSSMIQFKFKLNSDNPGEVGDFVFAIGKSVAGFSNGNNVANVDLQSVNVFAGLRFSLNANGSITSYIFNGSNWASLPFQYTFIQNTTYIIEFYCNNSSTAIDNDGLEPGPGTLSIPSRQWYLRINGQRFGPFTQIGGININDKINAFLIGGYNSPTNSFRLFVDDLRYSTSAVTFSPLPVTFKSLKVNSTSNLNQLKWETASELNNKGFEVQRAIQNPSDFKTIGFVGSRSKDGNSQTEIGYSFDDADVKAGQTYYYRLRQIDFDGKVSLSPIRSINPGSIESNLNVYPNPSQGSVTVTTGSSSGKLNIYVVDNTGRTINQYMNVSTSSTRINNLRKGFYTLKIVNTETGEQSAQRLLVQ